MAENEDNQLGGVTSFSQLLFEVENDVEGLSVDGHHHHNDRNQVFNYNNNGCSPVCNPVLKPPKMLCFGDFQNQNNNSEIGFPEVSCRSLQKSSVTCSDSSSVSSTSKSCFNDNNNNISNNKKRNCLAEEQPVKCDQRSSKKSKTEKPKSQRREALGDRVSALQQLVSPFGKTDTASVLHEACGYIRFLHEQVQVLCSPYLKRSPLPLDAGEVKEERSEEELRSRGLCLVPVDCTAHVVNNNGADFWSPVTMANNNNYNYNDSSSSRYSLNGNYGTA